MTAPVRTTVTHSYWCEGCDRSYEGEPNNGYAFSEGLRDDEGRQIHDSKVLIGEPVKYCGQDDDDVCILVDGDNWSWNECPVFTCGSCGKEFAADPDNDACSDHSYSSETNALKDAEKCCSGTLPVPPAPEVTGITIDPKSITVTMVTERMFAAGDIVQVIKNRPHNADLREGDLVKIAEVQTDTPDGPEKRYYVNSVDGGPTYWLTHQTVQTHDPNDNLAEKFNRKEAPKKKKVELDF